MVVGSSDWWRMVMGGVDWYYLVVIGIGLYCVVAGYSGWWYVMQSKNVRLEYDWVDFFT